ncbi:M14 family metallopeptidase [Archangium lansingense]|uniref:M14 family metallopeptidase n=1 Tax=Archangium lansingense TaxID=2995310 RepID=A0ABT4ACC9_9BACT|nr:M14 family metallopeptidase [Archangium lansinium]MCY1079322.1 M14 family metallopeptidase [Archangium lansinium]
MRALALAMLLTAGLARGEGYPIPRGEHPVAWKAAESIGEWKTEGNALALATPRALRNYFIQEEEAASPVPFVRARLQSPARADLAILFRAKVRATQPLFALTGYGLYVDGRKETVGFVRYDGTRSDDSGVRAKVPGLAKVAELELVLFLAGPAFAVHVYDARTKAELASLVWSDAAFAGGSLGVYAHRNQSAEVRVSLFVPDPPPQEASARDGLSLEWLVRVERGLQFAPELRRHLRRAAREAEADVYIASELGVHLLRESSVSVRDLRPGVPYRFLDPTFRERLERARKAPVRKGFVEGLKDPELIERAMRALAARAPERTRIIEIGRTHEDRPILALLIGEALDDHSRPAMLLCGGTHANEVVTPELPLDAARWLLENAEDKRVARWLRTFHVVIVPLVNPDGSHGYWHVSTARGRTNRHKDAQAAELGLLEYGVDLNRNYPFQWGSVEDRFNSEDPRSPFFHGPAAGSEPEVQAMMKLGEAWRFVGMVSYHAAATRLLVPYTVEGAREPKPSAAWAVAPAMIDAVAPTPGGKRYEAVRHLYPVAGTDQDWFYWSFGTLAYLVELPFVSPGPRRPLAPMVEGARGFWQVLFDRFLDGPALTVQVPESFKAEGPVTVAVEELSWPNGERFSAHPESGVFHTYLPTAGRYTVKATSASGKTVSRAVDVGTARVVLALTESP